MHKSLLAKTAFLGTTAIAKLIRTSNLVLREGAIN
jgi:hypothetical protein